MPELFGDVDLILHAGDVGELRVLDALGEIAPTIAVHGNDETEEAQQSLPYQQILTVSGVRILLCHSHIPDRTQELASRTNDSWASKLARLAKQAHAVGAPIYVFGHAHIPLAKEHEGVMLVNPGAIASGNAFTRQMVQSVALLSLPSDGDISVKHVVLADRGPRTVPEIDWSAGFRSALANVSQYLVTADDHITINAAYRVAGDEWPILDEAVLRCAWQRWKGRQDLITLDEIVRELKADPQAPVALFERLMQCLTAEAGNRTDVLCASRRRATLWRDTDRGPRTGML